MLLRRSAVVGGMLGVVALAGGCLSDEGRARNFDGPWVRHTIDDGQRGADGVRVADVNGDGLPDVTTGWEQAGITRVYLHPGHDAVREPWPAATVAQTPNVEDAVWADLDGDGNMDVVSSCEGTTRSIFFSFAPADASEFLNPDAWESAVVPVTVGQRWMYALPMDVDGRGGIDIVVGGKREGAVVGWLESPPNPRDLSAWKLHPMSPAGWIMSLDAFDMNGDGALDVLVSDRSSSPVDGVRWLERPADPSLLDGPWTNHFIGARKRSPVFIAPVPGEGGRPRAVIVPSGGQRLTLFEREDESGDLWSERHIPYPKRLGTPKSAAVGDIDLDGDLDVVLACTNLSGHEEGIVWLSRAADPLDEDPLKFSLSGAQGEKFDRMELLDLDGDGDLDVMTTEEIQELGLVWYENPLQ